MPDLSKSNIQNLHALSPLQEGLYFHALEASDSTAYFEQMSYRFTGRLDVERFRASWNELFRRHAIMRSVFIHKNSPRPLQVVLKKAEVEFLYEDISALSAEARQAHLQSFKQKDMARGFSLGRDTLNRVAVLMTASGEYEVLWSHHHILLDGWSIGVLHGELIELYRALGEGRPAALPQPIPYASYIKWIESLDANVSLDYWQEYLRDYDEPAGLPQLQAATQQEARKELRFTLDVSLTEGLNALAARRGVTLSTVVQCLWAVVLAKFSGREDVCFAATVSGRPASIKGVESMVGLFINAIPVRVKTLGHVSFSHLLAERHMEFLASEPYQYSSLADIQARSPLKYRLIDHILIFENYPVDEGVAGGGDLGTGFKVESVRLQEHTNYGFEIAVVPGRELSFRLGWNAAQYPQPLAEHLREAIEVMAREVAINEEHLVSSLSIMSPETRASVLEMSRGRTLDYPAQQSVTALFAAIAAIRADATAVVYEESGGRVRTLSYRELDRMSNRIARCLIDGYGVAQGQVVGLMLGRSERLIAAIFGILKAGCAYLPIEPGYPQERVAYMIEDGQCPVLITEQAFVDRAAGLPVSQVMDFQQALEHSDEPVDVKVRPQDAIYVMFTSGSTGRPKGVVLEHRNVIAYHQNLEHIYGMKLDDTLYAVTTATFDISVTELVCALLLGMRVVIASDEAQDDPALMISQMPAHGATVLQTTPSRLKIMLEGGQAQRDLGRLRVLMVGGEPLPKDLYEVLMTLSNTVVFNVYGPTEATIWSTSGRVDCDGPGIGRPLLNEGAYVLGPNDELLPPCVFGELCIGGDGVARGYLMRPELTREKFVPDPFRAGHTYSDGTSARMYRTGDRARYLPDGTLEFLGREDGQIKLRGYRIESGEIEYALLKAPGVKEAVVKAVQVRGLQELAAYIVGTDGARPDAAQLRKHLGQSLPEYMIPAYFVGIERVPLTANGKVNRLALPAPEIASVSAAHISPETAVQKGLAAAWADVLGVTRAIGLGDDFFELGGQSIKAIRLSARIQKDFGVRIQLKRIFECPSLLALSREVEGMMSTGTGSVAAESSALVSLAQSATYEASLGQRRLWFIQALEPNSGAYNMYFALNLGGTPDVGALKKSLSYLADRHEALRTAFDLSDGVPVQRVAGSVNVPLEVSDTVSSPDKVRRIIARAIARHFDLGKPPLMRALLQRIGSDEHVLVVAVHHIVCDGWSADILARELSEAYGAYVQGRGPAHEPLAVQFKEFAAYLNHEVDSVAGQRARHYWVGKLSDPPAPLDLPTDFPRPIVRSFRGGAVRRALQPGSLARLRAAATRAGTTEFAFFLTALKTLLHRYTGASDIVIGTAIAGREHPQASRVVGFFTDTLALRTSFDSQTSFSELLKKVRLTVLEAFDHAGYPFDRLVEELGLPRDTGRSPVFDVMVVEQRQAGTPQLAGLKVKPFEVASDTSKFDLTLQVFVPEEGLNEGLELALDYNADIFREETASRMLSHLVRLINSALDAPDMAVGNLDIMQEDERRKVLTLLKGQGVPAAADATIVEVFCRRAAESPDAPALEADGVLLNYGQLDRLSDVLASYLQNEERILPSEVVGLMVERGHGLVIGLLGIMKAGAVHMPIDPAYPEARVRYMIDNSGCRVLLAEARALGAASLYADALNVQGLETLIADPADFHPPVLAPKDLAYMIYTSGSTGKPKGVMVEHGGFVNMARYQARRFGIRPEDKVLLFASPSFDASLSEVFMALFSGATLVTAGPEILADPDGFMALVQRLGVTVVTLPPVYLSALRRMDKTGNLSGIRVLITAGEPAVADDAAHYSLGLRYFNAYGPTECSVCVSTFEVPQGFPRKGLVPIGTLTDNLESYILSGSGALQPVGVPGELCVAGVGLARGYRNAPEATERVFVPDPFQKGHQGRRIYRTGDLVRLLPSGDIEFLGRVDDQVKLRGYRIEPREIEHTLLACPGVEQAVVVLRDMAGALELVAYYAGANAMGQVEIRDYLRKRLPSYMVPPFVVALDRIPLNRSGKVDKAALPEPDRSGAEPLEPETELERDLLGVFKDVLGLSNIGVGDDFFALGGQSMKAIALVSKIRDTLKREAPLSMVFSDPTVRGLAHGLQSIAEYEERYAGRQGVRLSTGSENGQARVMCLPPIIGYSEFYRPLARKLPEFDFHGLNFDGAVTNPVERYAQTIAEGSNVGEPIVLMGYSSGGNLAFETARALEALGRPVRALVFFDTLRRLRADVVADDEMEAELGRHALDPETYADLAALSGTRHVREQLFRNIKQYIKYVDARPTSGTVGADIYLLLSENTECSSGLDRQWAENTSGKFVTRQGRGGHFVMLKAPHIEHNTMLIAQVLGEIFGGTAEV